MEQKGESAEGRWMTTLEAAEMLGVAPAHIRRLLIGGIITGEKWGRDWMVDQASLQAYQQEIRGKGRKRGPKPKTG